VPLHPAAWRHGWAKAATGGLRGLRKVTGKLGKTNGFLEEKNIVFREKPWFLGENGWKHGEKSTQTMAF